MMGSGREAGRRGLCFLLVENEPAVRAAISGLIAELPVIGTS